MSAGELCYSVQTRTTMPLTSLQLRERAPQTHPKESFSDSFAKISASTRRSDEDLVRGIAQKEEQALAQVYDRYAEMTCGVAMRILRDQDAAEDVVQATFLNLWSHAATLLSLRTPAAGWLALTAQRLALALLQGGPRHATPTLPIRFSASALTETDALIQHSREAMSSIMPHQRKALEIAFFDGLQPEEIAVSTGDTPDAIKAGIRASLLVLRKAVQA